MRRSLFLCSLAVAGWATGANAAVIRFAEDPFAGPAGEAALATAGRQVVGDELAIDFDVATDVFSFEAPQFGVSSLGFINDQIGNVPSNGVNLIVLETFDNDNDLSSPFNAGTAATLIANALATPTPGFFIYFNQGLNLPRLVFSPDLDSSESDLKVLARLNNFAGNTALLQGIAADNFQVPEPSSMLLLSGFGVAALALRRRRRDRWVEDVPSR